MCVVPSPERTWRAPANKNRCEQPRDDVYGPYDASYLNSGGAKQATQSPIVTGTSVIAIKFKDGVIMAADNLGMLARTHTVRQTLPNAYSLPYPPPLSQNPSN